VEFAITSSQHRDGNGCIGLNLLDCQCASCTDDVFQKYLNISPIAVQTIVELIRGIQKSSK